MRGTPTGGVPCGCRGMPDTIEGAGSHWNKTRLPCLPRLDAVTACGLPLLHPIASAESRGYRQLVSASTVFCVGVFLPLSKSDRTENRGLPPALASLPGCRFPGIFPEGLILRTSYDKHNGKQPGVHDPGHSVLPARH